MGNSFCDLLVESWERNTSLLCFGMDPVVERMKIDTDKNLADEIFRYFSDIMHEIILKITAVKPNIGFYLQYGLNGIRALHMLVNEAKELELPVILDGKFGDIGRTSEAYARFAFEELGVDAVTINPLMGFDAVRPFLQYSGKGVFILTLTSNKTAEDFQYLRVVDDGKPLYLHILDRLIGWNRNSDESDVGSVVGATKAEIKDIISKLTDSGSSIPLLIPGVGTQGGSYKEIDSILNMAGYKKGLVRINSSSAISYAHEKFKGFSYTEAAFLAVENILKS